MRQEAAGSSAMPLQLGAALLAAAVALGALAFQRFTQRRRPPKQIAHHEEPVDYTSFVERLDFTPEQDGGALLAGCRTVISDL